MYEEHGIRIVSLLDSSELIVVSSEEGFLPVEFISRSLRTREREVKRSKSERREWARDSHLVEVCAGFWCYAFEDLHILDEELTSSFDLCQIGAFPPGPADTRKDQTISPNRVKSRRIGIHTGNLSASDETVGKKKSQDSDSRVLEIVRRDLLVPEIGCNLEQFRGQIFGFIGLNDILGQQPG